MGNMLMCPYCEEEMKLGFINSGRFVLKWIPAENYKGGLKKLIPWEWHTEGIKLTEPLLDISSIEAFYCEKCNKIIIDTENMTNQITTKG